MNSTMVLPASESLDSLAEARIRLNRTEVRALGAALIGCPTGKNAAL